MENTTYDYACEFHTDASIVDLPEFLGCVEASEILGSLRQHGFELSDVVPDYTFGFGVISRVANPRHRTQEYCCGVLAELLRIEAATP